MCPRCAEKFENDQALQTHLRAVNLCDIRDFTFPDGIDSEQEEKIRTRPKRRDSTPREQWFSIYKIIFTDVQDVDLPRTPCKSQRRVWVRFDCGYLLTYTTKDCDDEGSQSLRDMHDFIRRGLPPIMRRQVKEEVERLTHGHEKELTTTIMRIIPDVLARMIESYERQKEQADNETLGLVTTEAGVANEPQPPELDHGLVGGFAPFDVQGNFEDLINSDFGDVLDVIDPEVVGLGPSAW